MKFPSIADVAYDLRYINANVEGECDVRLQVYPDGEWAIRYGLSDYDQDHHGYCDVGDRSKRCLTLKEWCAMFFCNDSNRT